MPYLKLYFEKKMNVSWDWMYDLANEEYAEKQKKSLEKKEHRRQKAEMMQLAKEKAQCAKEEQERIEREKAEQKAKEEAERLAKEQREKEEQIRLKAIGKQKLLEQEAKEAFGKFLPMNVINISSDDESSEDEEETKEDENKSKTGTVNGNKDLTTFNPVKVKKEKIDPELDKIATPPLTPEETNMKEGLDSDKKKEDTNDTSATALLLKLRKNQKMVKQIYHQLNLMSLIPDLNYKFKIYGWILGVIKLNQN